MRHLLTLALCATLAACGGGGGDATPADALCNPDSLDCASMYASFPHRFAPDAAEGADIYTYDPAPRAGYTRTK